MGQTHEPRSVERLAREPAIAQPACNLLHPGLQRPPRRKAGQRAQGLVEGHAIGPWVAAALAGCTATSPPPAPPKVASGSADDSPQAVRARVERFSAVEQSAFDWLSAADPRVADRAQSAASDDVLKRIGTEAVLAEDATAQIRGRSLDLFSFAARSRALKAASDEASETYGRLRDTWFERLLGPERDPIPTSAHTAYMRRLSTLEATYTKDRATEVCLETLRALGFDLEQQPNIRLDLDDRPQKAPRACVIASDPPNVVHLITRAQGGLHDYQAFLHEAGHALHFGLTSDALPFEHRYVSPDNALTEIYSYVVERITHEPLWHMRHFGLSREDAERVVAETRFIDASLFRRYGAKLAYELEFWADPRDPRNPQRYADRLAEWCLLAPQQWFNFYAYWDARETAVQAVSRVGESGACPDSPPTDKHIRACGGEPSVARDRIHLDPTGADDAR